MSLDKKTVARRYARALFELVDADNEIDQTYQELIALRQVFEDNEGLEGALAGVQMSFADKKALVNALQEGASQYVQNLIQMLLITAALIAWSQLLMSLNGGMTSVTSGCMPTLLQRSNSINNNGTSSRITWPSISARTRLS